METLFTKIIRGEIPCHKIAEDENFIAFLDIHPINPGHTLVVPKKEFDYIFDGDDTTLAQLIVFSKKVALAIRKTVPCIRVGIMVAGLEIPHCHIHLVPIVKMSDLNFENAKSASGEDLKLIAEKIKKNILL
ncbi:MAG TPA: HIT family protein [Candidatus Omnitrophota bacterium]|nr:HIT family protein [Candidatus Omnitrophota bacterium]HPN88517.1 HIT family protein [Candidatus Omnitrophota bacterium]